MSSSEAQLVRHDAQYSDEVLRVIRRLLHSTRDPVEGLICDPFAGPGLKLDQFAREDLYGLEIEPEWAEVTDRVRCGDALSLSAYLEGTKTIVTSPCYGNRMADKYLGAKCKECHGTGLKGAFPCAVCSGSGRDPEDQKRRFSYAIALGRVPSAGSAATMAFTEGNAGTAYRGFHLRWLATIADVVPPGPNRLILNMSDHYRTTGLGASRAQRRHYVCSWWVNAARSRGFELVHAEPAKTQRFGFGANQQDKPTAEMVFVFDRIEG